MGFSAGIQIADVKILLESDFPIEATARYEPFLAENSSGDYQARLLTTDHLVFPHGEILAEENGFEVLWNTELGYFRIYRDEMRKRNAYAVSQYDRETGGVRVSFTEDGRKHARSLGPAFFHIGWEELMLRAERLAVHACCLDTPYGGILFSGPSGIGKSTQGDLWCQYTESRVINGDRPILYLKHGTWVAAGSPYAGSSDIYLNEAVPVRAIVMLRQSPENMIRRMNPGEAIHAIWPGLAVSDWNPELVDMALNLAEKVSTELPFYAMDCTADKKAVDVLKQVLEEESHAG